jgi:peptidyl-tRNA hydrolase
MANLIQRILVRTDLEMPVGLLAAQVAHIHAAPFIQTYRVTPSPGTEFGDCVENIKQWMSTPYLFVHRVPNKEVLNYFIDECTDRNVWFHEWKDTIYIDISDTQKKAFDNVTVGISIGPADSDEIKTIVGDLPLL